MSYTKFKKLLVLKLETTSGTAIAMTNSDADIKFAPDSITLDASIDEYVQEVASGRHSIGPSTMGSRMGTVSAVAPLLLPATAGTAPKIGKAFKSCGWLETTVAETFVAYTPNAGYDEGNGVTATIAVYFIPTTGDALIATFKGCLGEVEIGLDKWGNPFTAKFDWTGAFVGVTYGSALALTSPDTGYAPALKGTAVTVGGTAIQTNKLLLKAGNSIVMDPAADATGYKAAVITRRQPTWAMDRKMIASDGVYTNWAAGTQVALSAETDVVNSQKIQLTAPAGSLQGDGVKFADRDNINAWDMTFRLGEASGNDEHSIKFMAAS